MRFRTYVPHYDQTQDELHGRPLGNRPPPEDYRVAGRGDVKRCYL